MENEIKTRLAPNMLTKMLSVALTLGRRVLVCLSQARSDIQNHTETEREILRKHLEGTLKRKQA